MSKNCLYLIIVYPDFAIAKSGPVAIGFFIRIAILGIFCVDPGLDLSSIVRVDMHLFLVQRVTRVMFEVPYVGRFLNHKFSFGGIMLHQSRWVGSIDRIGGKWH